jgi:hypothetical protein
MQNHLHQISSYLKLGECMRQKERANFSAEQKSAS